MGRPDKDDDGKIPDKDDRREGEYVKPGPGISPGAHPGTIAPTEDPREDAGLEPDDPEAQPKK